MNQKIILITWGRQTGLKSPKATNRHPTQVPWSGGESVEVPYASESEF